MDNKKETPKEPAPLPPQQTKDVPHIFGNPKAVPVFQKPNDEEIKKKSV